jgi:hypothetical protein
MAVTLTSTGIQYPDSTVQTVSGKYSLVAQTYVSGNGALSYTYTGISQNMRRLLFMIWKTSFNSGPQSPKIEFKNSAAATISTVVGGTTYANNMSTGNGGSASVANYQAGGTGSNLFFAQSYATFNSLWLEVILVPEGLSTKKYTYRMWSHGNPVSGTYIHMGDGYFNSTSPITEMILSTGSGSVVFSDITATLWQA